MKIINIWLSSLCVAILAFIKIMIYVLIFSSFQLQFCVMYQI